MGFPKTLSALILLAVVYAAVPAFSADLDPYVPSKSHAPLYPGPGSGTSSATPADMGEINGEFGGLLYMAQNEYSYERWPGRDMSDCRAAPADGVCQSCELIMGHISAEYYFYKEPGKSRCTLKQIDAHLAVSDPEMLKQLRRTAQRLFGMAPLHGSKPPSKELGWGGSGAGWKWETGEDLAYLYLNNEEMTPNGYGVARFQWRRAPLPLSDN
jgi:hypothetical protein